MSFREPLLLAGLVLVPLALLAYWAAQRRRRRYAIRYPAVDVLASVAGKARGRHIPALLALLALAALAISLARPERTVAVEQRQGTVMLVHDTSGSMQATDVKPDRLSAARDAARTLDRLAAGGVPARRHLVQHAASSSCRDADDRPLAGAARDRGAQGPGRHGDGRRAAARRSTRSATPVTGADGRPQRLPGRDRAALRRREHHGPRPARGRQDAPRSSRSRSTRSRSARRTAGSSRPTGSTTPVPPDTATLDSIARTTGGRFFTAPTARDLEAVYANLGRGPGDPQGEAGGHRRRSPAARWPAARAGWSPGCCATGGCREGAATAARARADAGAARARGRSPTRSCARSTSR